MRSWEANINQAVPNVSCVGQNVVDGSVSGTTDISVLRFGTENNSRASDATWIAPNVVADGDVISVTRAGVYQATLQFSVAAAVNVSIGISLNVAGAALLAVEPVLTTPFIGVGMIATQHTLWPAATSNYAVCSATFVVTRAQANAVGGALVRFHGTEADGTVIPDASIDENTECQARLVLISNIT